MYFLYFGFFQNCSYINIVIGHLLTLAEYFGYCFVKFWIEISSTNTRTLYLAQLSDVHTIESLYTKPCEYEMKFMEEIFVSWNSFVVSCPIWVPIWNIHSFSISLIHSLQNILLNDVFVIRLLYDCIMYI